MNILLWILQILLALHTAAGALWKFSVSEQEVDSLKVMPHEVWLTLGVLELLCVLGLILPAFYRRLAKLVPLSAAFIGAEMLVFCEIHLASEVPGSAEIIYWLVVAAVCAFLAYGRLSLKPL